MKLIFSLGFVFGVVTTIVVIFAIPSPQDRAIDRLIKTRKTEVDSLKKRIQQAPPPSACNPQCTFIT